MEIGRSYINENGFALLGSMCRTGWHLEDQNQEGSKSKDVKHQKKHLCTWQIHTSPDLWRHPWAENLEEVFTPDSYICQHMDLPTHCANISRSRQRCAGASWYCLQDPTAHTLSRLHVQ